MKVATATRFWSKVNKTYTCWLWTGSLTPAGYGRFWDGEKTVYPHRFAYELLVGAIPAGLEIDHVKELCGNRHCVNPAHLEPVTHTENVSRGESFTAKNSKKTHCPQGHPYDGSNTDLRGGYRYCRACKRA